MLLPKITEKQKQILLLLYRFRFLHRIHIQTLLKNKDHHNINVWLKDLTEKKFIARIYTDAHQKNNKPAIYYLSVYGVKYLRTIGIDQSLLQKFHQEKRRSASYIQKSIMIADMFFELGKIESINQQSFKFYTQSDFPLDGVIRNLMPDFAYVYSAHEELQHFVGEVFGEKALRIAIKGRIKKYIEFIDDNEGVNTSIIFICHTPLTKNYIEKSVRKYVQSEGECSASVYTATIDEVKNNGLEMTGRTA